MEQFFKLFSDCIPVRGIGRGVICDLSQQRYRFIPLELFDVLALADKFSIYTLNQMFPDVELFLNLFIKENYGFLCDENELSMFPKLSMEFKTPSYINNAIIDIVDYNNQKNNIAKFISEVDILGCEALQIRSYTYFDQFNLGDLISLINKSNISYIELVLKYKNLYETDEFGDFYLKNSKIRSIIIHSSPDNRHTYFNTDGHGDLVFITEVINDNSHCGVVDSSIFNINIKMFTESLSFNSCLHKKIALDNDGFIKMCPSMKENFGHIHNTKLSGVIGKKKFIEMGNLTKDQISVCNVCEFRYICTDCRAFVATEDDIYSKPAKCNYDPYSQTWNNSNI